MTTSTILAIAIVVAWVGGVYAVLKVSDRRRNRRMRSDWEARSARLRTDEQFLEAQYERATATLRSIATGPSGRAQEEALEVLRINHNAELQRERARGAFVCKGDESTFLPELDSAEPN